MTKMKKTIADVCGETAHCLSVTDESQENCDLVIRRIASGSTPWLKLMSAEQFAALAKLLKMRGGVSQEAARLVLVEGLAPSFAAQRVGTSPQAVSNALASCRRGIELARIVTE